MMINNLAEGRTLTSHTADVYARAVRIPLRIAGVTMYGAIYAMSKCFGRNPTLHERDGKQVSPGLIAPLST